MKVLLLVDLETLPADDPTFTAPPDPSRQSVEYHVARALRELQHEVTVLAYGPDLPATIQALLAAAPEVVFNLTEWVGGDRRKDAHIAALLELLRVRYTGAPPASLMLCRDKATCKRILSHHHVHLPDFVELAPGRVRVPARLAYPMIVKPLYEDGSDGIALASLVKDKDELAQRATALHERMKQPVICEEFVAGREIYVGVLGGARPQVLPPRELTFGATEGGGPLIATAKVKWDEAYRQKWNINYGPAVLSDDLLRRVGTVARRVYDLLGLRDYARIDFRLTPEGALVFLEANPNPNLGADEDVAEAAKAAGIAYPQLIDRIVNAAARRNG